VGLIYRIARSGDVMAENQQMVVYAAAYESENAALDDLAAIEELHNDKLIGTIDAAVIDL
jgi:hypothetical protein